MYIHFKNYRQAPSDSGIMDNKQFQHLKIIHRKPYSQGSNKDSRREGDWNTVKQTNKQTKQVEKWLYVPKNEQHSGKRKHACKMESS